MDGVSQQLGLGSVNQGCWLQAVVFGLLSRPLEVGLWPWGEVPEAAGHDAQEKGAMRVQLGSDGW